MQTKPVWEFIDLGVKLGHEQFFSWCFTLDNDVFAVKERIGVTDEELIKTLEELDLLGARGVVQYFTPIVDGENSNTRAEILLSAIQSESERIQVFAVTKKRYDTKDLLNNVSAIFGRRVFASLHVVAQSDFSDSGKCIAFDLPTSAAFHLMRGTEMVLRQFYRAKTGKDAGEKNWGPIVDELKKSENPQLKPLYDHLNNIRVNFRNPTQHPDKIYDNDEAQDLFGLCIDVVDRMIMEILQQQDKSPE